MVADLNGTKDTIKMLASLNACFPHAKVRLVAFTKINVPRSFGRRGGVGKRYSRRVAEQ